MRALLVTVLVMGCGGAAVRPTDDGAEARAIAAWQRGELEETARIALEHREGASEALREVGARAALALGCPDEARAVLGAGRSEPLARARASVHLAREEWSEAARILAALPRADDDPYAILVAEVAQALGDRVPFEGEIRSEPIRLEELAMPVIPVAVEGRATLALVATSVDVTLVSPALRASSGALDELQLGATRISNVPFFVRPLDDESEALGATLGVVIGTDLLLRAGAVIDTPHGVLALGAEGGDAIAPILLDGSFAVARGEEGAFFVLDTAGAFDVALTPRGGELLRGDPIAIEGGPAPMQGVQLAALRARDARGALAIDARDVLALRDVLDDTLERITDAPIAGAIGWGVLRHGPLALAPRACALTARAE